MRGLLTWFSSPRSDHFTSVWIRYFQASALRACPQFAQQSGTERTEVKLAAAAIVSPLISTEVRQFQLFKRCESGSDLPPSNSLRVNWDPDHAYSHNDIGIVVPYLTKLKHPKTLSYSPLVYLSVDRVYNLCPIVQPPW